MYIVPLVLALLIGLVHYFTDWFSEALHKYERALTSFVAGLTIVYVFLELLPRLFIKVQFSNRLIFVWIIFGFLIMYLSHKYIYHHVQNRDRIKSVKESHAILLFIFYLFIGILLVMFSNEGYRVLGFFWLILILNLIVNNLSMHNIYALLSGQTWFKIIIASATVIGAIIGFGFSIAEVWLYAFIGLFSGLLLYTSIKTLIYDDQSFGTKWFIIGQLIFVLLILVIWLI